MMETEWWKRYLSSLFKAWRDSFRLTGCCVLMAMGQGEGCQTSPVNCPSDLCQVTTLPSSLWHQQTSDFLLEHLNIKTTNKHRKIATSEYFIMNLFSRPIYLLSISIYICYFFTRSLPVSKADGGIFFGENGLITMSRTEWMEWYQPHGFHVFVTITLTPLQPLLWALLPSPASCSQTLW